MKLTVKKPEKISLCRRCKGTGLVEVLGRHEVCPQCKGSGRVIVSCTMELEVKPWSLDKQQKK